jgi:hypothetical protein
MIFMHNASVHKHSIRLATKAGEEQGPFMLNDNSVGVCVKLVTPRPLETEVGAIRESVTLRHEATIQSDASCPDPGVPIEVEPRRSLSYMYCEFHGTGLCIAVQQYVWPKVLRRETNTSKEAAFIKEV